MLFHSWGPRTHIRRISREKTVVRRRHARDDGPRRSRTYNSDSEKQPVDRRQLRDRRGRVLGVGEARQGAPRGAEAGRYRAASLLGVAAAAWGRARESYAVAATPYTYAPPPPHTTHTRNSPGAIAVDAPSTRDPRESATRHRRAAHDTTPQAP